MGHLDEIERVKAIEDGGGSYIPVGTFLVEIIKIKSGQNRKDRREFFAVEGRCRFIFEDPDGQARVGKEMSYYNGFNYPDSDLGLIKTLLGAVLTAKLQQTGKIGFDQIHSADQVDKKITAQLVTDQAGAGALVQVTGFQKPGKKFTHYKWSAPSPELLALVGTQPNGFSKTAA